MPTVVWHSKQTCVNVSHLFPHRLAMLCPHPWPRALDWRSRSALSRDLPIHRTLRSRRDLHALLWGIIFVYYNVYYHNTMYIGLVDHSRLAHLQHLIWIKQETTFNMSPLNGIMLALHTLITPWLFAAKITLESWCVCVRREQYSIPALSNIKV